MTEQQVTEWLDQATIEELADYNDNADDLFAPVNGSNSTNGAEVAQSYNGFNETQKQYVRDYVSNVKNPC